MLCKGFVRNWGFTGMSKITESSRGQSCIRCGAPGAYACHYNGIRQHSFGKGRGIKCHDLASAELCHNCDRQFIEGTIDSFDDRTDRSEQFLFLCMLTNISRFKRGDLK